MNTSNVANAATGKALHPVHSVYDGFFNTSSGKVINLKNPDPDTIDLKDIALALSNICRFGGHTSHFYSVAQHSLLVASIAPDRYRREALLHDSAEAYVNDVIKPLKVMLKGYDEIEARFMKVISQKFDLNAEKLKAIKVYDLLACELEHEFLQKGLKNPDYGGTILYEFLPTGICEHKFLVELHKYL